MSCSYKFHNSKTSRKDFRQKPDRLRGSGGVVRVIEKLILMHSLRKISLYTVLVVLATFSLAGCGGAIQELEVTRSPSRICEEIAEYVTDLKAGKGKVVADRIVFSAICLDGCVTVKGHVNNSDFLDAGSVMLGEYYSRMDDSYVLYSGDSATIFRYACGVLARLNDVVKREISSSMLQVENLEYSTQVFESVTLCNDDHFSKAESAVQEQSCRVDSIRLRILEITDLPYYLPLSGDSLYWQLVIHGKDVAADLIELMDDSTQTRIPMPNLGGNYTVGDVSFLVLKEVFHDMSWKVLVNAKDSEETYHSFVRSRAGNRITLKNSMREWYKDNQDRFTWVQDSTYHDRVGLNWKYSNYHPAGGYWVVD